MPIRFLSAALAALTLVPAAAWGQALAAAVPASAKIVVLVRDLDALLDRSNQFVVEGCGLPAPKTNVVEITGLLGNLGAAWKTQRGVAFAISELSPEGAAVLFPVEDGAATLAKLGGEAADGGRKFDLVGKPMFGAAKGSIVAVGPAAAALKAFQDGGASLESKLNAAQQKLAGADNVFFYANVQALKGDLEKLAGETDKLRDLLKNVKGLPANVTPEQAAAAVKHIVNGLGREVEAVYGSANFSRDAAVFHLGFEFKADGRGAKALANCGPSSAELFGKLPEGSFVAAFGVDLKNLMEGFGVKGQAQDLGLGVLSAALTEGAGGSALLGRVTAKDAAQVNQMVAGLLGLAPVFAGNVPDLKLAPSQTKIGGTDVNELKAEFGKIPAEGMELMKIALGGSALRLQHGVVGEALGFALGGQENAFAGLQAGGNLQATTRVREATRLLPAGAAVAALVDPLAALRLAQRIAAKTKPNDSLAKVAIPADPGTPAAFAATFGKDGIELHLALPSITVKQLAPMLQALNQ